MGHWGLQAAFALYGIALGVLVWCKTLYEGKGWSKADRNSPYFGLLKVCLLRPSNHF
jgi:hypothetical protein